MVWASDLNSLYEDKPRKPVVVERGLALGEAVKLRKEVTDNITASWITDAFGNVINLLQEVDPDGK